jgi:hypothetical protein
VYRLLITFGITKELVRLIKLDMQEMTSRVRIDKHKTQRLKQISALSQTLLNFALRTFHQECPRDGLELNCTNQDFRYADDVNLL